MKKGKIVFQAAVIAFAIATLPINTAYANNQLDNRLKLLQKLDMLDALDFQDAINAANSCSGKKQFDCARENIEKANKLASTDSQKRDIEQSKTQLDNEIKLVKLAEERRAIEEEIRKEKVRFEERKRELARQREIEQRKAQEKKDKAAGLGLLAGLAVGISAVNSGIDPETAAELSKNTYTGTYGVFSGDTAAMQTFDKNMADLNRRLKQKQAQQDAIFQENLRRQQQAEQQKREERARQAALAQQEKKRQATTNTKYKQQKPQQVKNQMIAGNSQSGSTASNKQCTYKTVSGRMTPAGEATETLFRGPYVGGLGETRAEAITDLEDTLHRLCYFFTNDPGFSLSNTDCEPGNFGSYSCDSDYTCNSKYEECNHEGGSAVQY